MRGGLGSLRHSKPISRNPQPLSSSATTNNVHIRVASNTQGSSARGARRRIPTTETDIIATAPKAAAPQQHAPTTASASGESSSLIKNATNQTSDGQIKSKSPSKQAPLANPQAATAQTSETLLQDPALIEYCSGCFIDPMAVEKCPQLHARYQENEGLIRDFLDKLQMPNRRVAMDFALVSKTKQKNSAVATILFTCLDDDQKKQIESGLHKRNVIPPGFVARIIVWKFEYASRLISTPLNPGKYAGRRVEASFVEGRETMCGILGRLSSQGKSELEISAFTLGGTIIVDDAVFVLTTAHSLFQSTDTDIGRRRSSDGERSSFTILPETLHASISTVV
jgi:hypothetical protein